MTSSPPCLRRTANPPDQRRLGWSAMARRTAKEQGDKAGMQGKGSCGVDLTLIQRSESVCVTLYASVRT